MLYVNHTGNLIAIKSKSQNCSQLILILFILHSFTVANTCSKEGSVYTSWCPCWLPRAQYHITLWVPWSKYHINLWVPWAKYNINLFNVMSQISHHPVGATIQMSHHSVGDMNQISHHYVVATNQIQHHYVGKILHQHVGATTIISPSYCGCHYSTVTV